jgi:hypothetical protein
MDDLPNEETRSESNGDGNESTSSLERETRATNQVESVSMGNGDLADDDLVGEEAVENVEIEVVLLSNDEEDSGDLPRTLTDNGSGPFHWYLLAPGALAAAGAAALLLKYRSPEGQNGRFLSGQMSAGAAASALQALSGAGGGLGSVAGSQKARAQALAAQAMARAGKAPAPKQKTAWEEAQASVRTAVTDNLVTIIALAASAGLTIAGRMVDVKREGALPLQPPPKKAWYQVGPWS